MVERVDVGQQVGVHGHLEHEVEEAVVMHPPAARGACGVEVVGRAVADRRRAVLNP
jgi:hypothetical protein